MSDGLTITFDDAAVYYMMAWMILGRMGDAEPAIEDRNRDKPLPRGMFTCGEATDLLPLLLVLLVDKFPRLVEQDVVDAAVRTAVLPSQTVQ